MRRAIRTAEDVLVRSDDTVAVDGRNKGIALCSLHCLAKGYRDDDSAAGTDFYLDPTVGWCAPQCFAAWFGGGRRPPFVLWRALNQYVTHMLIADSEKVRDVAARVPCRVQRADFRGFRR